MPHSKKTTTVANIMRLMLLSLSMFSMLTLGLPSQVKAAPEAVGKIVGGSDAGRNVHPYMVALFSVGGDNSSRPFCGGTLISPRHVLTAAHCVVDANPAEVEIVVDIYNVDTDTGDRASVGTISLHPGYRSGRGSADTSYDNDIAILTLLSDVTSVAPISIISLNDLQALPAGELLTAVGWGNTSATERVYPDVLQSVEIPLVDDAQCRTFWGNTFRGEMFCAGFDSGGRDTCQGDSGGPVVIERNGNWIQVGITSFGAGCAQPASPGVYTSVRDYATWISSIVDGFSFTSSVNSYVPFDRQQSVTLGFTNATNFAISNVAVTSNDNINVDDLSHDCTIDKELGEPCSLVVSYTPLSSGDGQFQIEFASDSSTYDLNFPVYFSALPALSISNDTDVSFYSGGDRPWYIAGRLGTDGTSALSNGNIDDNESSVLIVVAQNATEVSFDYRTSTEVNYDFLNVIVSGQTVLSESGERDFQTRSNLNLADQESVIFEYKKDPSVSSGLDSVFIDNIQFSSRSTVSFDGGSDDGGSFSLFGLVLLMLFALYRRQPKTKHLLPTAIVGSTLFLSACGMTTSNDANAESAHPQKMQGTEALYGLSKTTGGLQLKVVSHGCTSSKNFQAMITGKDQVSVFRIKEDLCRAMPRLIDITLNYPEGVDKHSTFELVNELRNESEFRAK